MTLYMCHDCKKNIPEHSLKFECMCDDGETNWGHCKSCFEMNGLSNIPKGHVVQKYHFISDEGKQFLDKVFEYNPNSFIFSDGFMTITYMEGPNGERSVEEMEKNNLTEEEKMDMILNLKSKTFTDFPLAKLNCDSN